MLGACTGRYTAQKISRVIALLTVFKNSFVLSKCHVVGVFVSLKTENCEEFHKH